jgi:cytochrome c peroxidase
MVAGLTRNSAVLQLLALASFLLGGLAFIGCEAESDDLKAASASQSTLPRQIPLAPGYGPLGFEAPEPGSYELPPLGDAANGQLLASDGSSVDLHDFLGEKVVILSLMYASCSDVNGCPLATAVLHQIASEMKQDAALGDGLRLLSLSFDPARDTPEVMRQFGSHHTGNSGHGEHSEHKGHAGSIPGSGEKGKSVDWRFLTTESQAQLRPVLAAYGQSLVPEFDEAGNEIGDISHILRVFLIDASRRIRNIYSVSYLHADTLIADVKTLQLEARQSEDSSDSQEKGSSSGRTDESGVANDRIDTASLSSRPRGRRAGTIDLVGRAEAVQLGLPQLEIPSDNPLSTEKVALGRALFFDRRLSLNSTLSCAMCHVPAQGFAQNELATAVGIEGRTVRRNAPTILNVGFAKRLFHDGRENRLDHQVWGPLLARNEMGNPSVGTVIERIRGIAGYETLFAAAFPNRGLAIETVGMAIASYERTLISGDSAFDRWYFEKDDAALSEEAIKGFGLFMGKGGCSGCHSITMESALLSDGGMHNTGVGYKASMSIVGADQPVELAPGEVVAVSRELIAEVSEARRGDLGLYEITEDPDDRWKYKTPTLRNVALTAPYMHDGSLRSLREVVEFYALGGVPNLLLDEMIRPFELEEAEIDQLVSFLRSLTGGDVAALIEDGNSAPIGGG